jgi:predicted ATP-grasp superfamily ATP-dependent carboligase
VGYNEGTVPQKPEVLIVNSQNWLGLARLPRTLSKASCRITVLGIPGGAILRSRFVDHHIPTPRPLPELMDGLRRHLDENSGRYRWVIFGDEPALLEASQPQYRGWVGPLLPCTETLRMVLSKAPFAEACVQSGIPIPRTHICRGWNEIQAAAADVGYPFMLKDPEAASGAGVRKMRSPDELQAACRDGQGPRTLLVQQFLEGKVGASEVLFDRGRLVCWFASYVMKNWPGDFGPSSARELADHPAMDSILEKIGGMTGFHGFCGVDWIRDPRDDSLRVLELNPRPTPCYHLGPLAGVDFARSVTAMLAGDRVLQRPRLPGTRRRLVYLFPQHLTRCIESGDLEGLSRWLPGMAIHDVPWDDPVMLARQVLKLGYVGARTAVRSLKA